MKIFKRLRALKNKISPISHGKWDTLKIMLDYAYCKMRFHITLEEYMAYSYYNLKNRYRKNFLTNYQRKHYNRNISQGFFTSYKYVFYKRVPDLFSRGITLVPYCGEDEFVEFLKKYKKVVLKPDRGSWGVGIECFEYTNEASARERFKSFSKEMPMICEEYIRQHHSLEELSPFSVNTLRIVTILNGDNVEILSTVLKTGGDATKVVDNMRSGGIGAQVDIETGIVTTFGRDFQNIDYAYHPVTGVQFIGYNVPNWDKVKKLVIDAHRRVPQCLIYGWDIAVTEDGADIVEANNAPGPMLMQAIDAIPRGEKIIKMMKTIKIEQEYSKKNRFVPDYTVYFKD